MTQFQEIEVPRGSYISFAKPGQTFTLKVVSFDPTGGKDYNDQPVPLLVGQLTEDADNYRDKGTTHEKLTAGTLVQVNAGLDNLRRGLLIANPSAGDFVRLTFTGVEKVDKGEVKTIKVEHAKGSNEPEEDDL